MFFLSSNLILGFPFITPKLKLFYFKFYSRFSIYNSKIKIVSLLIIFQAFVFSETGLHLETRSLFTDALLLQFFYNKNQLLTTIKDQSGFVLIERNSNSEVFIKLNRKMLTHKFVISEQNKLKTVEFPSGKVSR